MKFKYLGTAAAEGVPAIFCNCENCRKSKKLGGKNIRTRSQAIVDDKLLIDFPPDTYLHYLHFYFPLEMIKSCLITHSHQDHLYAEDIIMRRKGFANISGNPFPLTFYSDASGYDIINKTIGDMEDVKCRQIELYTPMQIEDYIVTALRATHAPETSPVLYIIEKDGKSIFYSHDTSIYCEKTYNYLKGLKPLSLISLDCDEGCLEHISPSHLSLWQCIDIKDDFLKNRIADENTIFVLNHFSHNAKNVVYDEFSQIAEKYGFLTSYDGMEIEI